MHRLVAASAVMLLVVAACGAPQEYDVVIRNGTIYDGSGGAPYRGDLAIEGDTHRRDRRPRAAPSGTTEIDAAGLAVSPGFINMLSWANESLIEDGLGQSDIRQGVTLEVFGEGSSMGPLSETMKEGKLESAGRHPLPDRVDHARRVPGMAHAAVAWRRTSPRSSGRPRCASTCSATRTGRRRMTELGGCAPSWGRRWRKGRWAWGRP